MGRQSTMESMAGLIKKTALVTGGAGFIGSHLVESLVSGGYNVVVADIAVDPRSYYIVNKIYPNSTLEICDVRDADAVSYLFDKYSFEYVFHLAAEPIVEKAFENPRSAFETNIMGTVNILEACRKSKGIKGILVASSDKAYGKTEKTYTEESPLKGDHPYDVSKSAEDLIAYTYFSSYGLPVVITRFGNVYGEGDMHLNRIVPGICVAIIKNKTLEIRSNGKYIRDYLYVKDVVAGCVILMEKINKTKGEAYNFSSSENLQVLEVVKSVGEILDIKILTKILNIAKNEIPYQHLNDAKMRKLGWKNNFNLSNTLPKILNWYRKIMVD